MPIPTSRTKENGQITINQELCNGCGFCVDICKDFSLKIENGKAVISDTPFFGCFGCGQCVAICPNDAITVEGRFNAYNQLFQLPKKEDTASYNQLTNLLQHRRSTRDFKDKPVEKVLLDKIIAAAETAPVGLPPSDVNILLMESKEKVRQFAVDFCKYLEGMQWFVSKWFQTLMRPFWSKATYKMYKDFLRPLVHGYINSMKEGNDHVTYDAPAALYFYGSPYSDPADPIIPATYAMIAAESLGLGSCMIGGVHPFTINGGLAKKFREKHNIHYKSKEGLILIIGYPKYKFKKGIRRSFANIDSLN